MRCAGCGGVLGRDCWNEQDCVWISQDMAYWAGRSEQPEPCQGCSEITEEMRECISLCAGLTSDTDIAARRAVWRSIPLVFGAGQ